MPNDLIEVCRGLQAQGVAIPVLDIDGLLKAKTDYREKDRLDKTMLRRLQGNGA